jgi:hypothetical protein
VEQYWKRPLNILANALGMGEADTLAFQEQFMQNKGQLVLSEAQKMKGALSDKDIMFLNSMQADVKNTPEGAAMMLYTLKAGAQRAQMRAAAVAALKPDRTKGMTDWRVTDEQVKKQLDDIPGVIVRFETVNGKRTPVFQSGIDVYNETKARAGGKVSHEQLVRMLIEKRDAGFAEFSKRVKAGGQLAATANPAAYADYANADMQEGLA